jgi:tetratricopeptide (TPR) repeat protein
VPLYRELGDRLALCSAHGLLGEAQAYLGRYDEARDHFQTGLALARETGERRDSADYGYGLIDPHGLGLVELAQGRFAPAQEHLEAAISICRALDFQDYQEYYSALLACAALGLGDTAGAKGYLRMALRPVAGTPSFLPIVFALPAMALLLVERGDAARAVELYALASRHPLVANNVWFEDVAGKQIAAAAASLPPDVAAAAQDRGRDRDLHATARELLEELGDEEQG